MVPLSLILSEQVGSLTALRLLWRRLGPAGCAAVFASVVAGMAKGEPWRALGPPVDRKDALSRRQIGSAVLLDRALRTRIPPDEARALVAEIVRIASVDFLGRNVPRLSRASILDMTPEKRSEFLEKIQSRFFNADADLTLKGDEALDLTIRRCRFVELLKTIGEPDMAAIFCEGDKDFFNNHQPDISLKRDKTLSCGDEICDFRFKWKTGGAD